MTDNTTGSDLQAKRNADARQMIVDAGVLTSEKVAADWAAQGRIFSIEHQGRTLYPRWQFGADGKPLPVIAEVLSVFKPNDGHEAWRTASWFFALNGWLGGRAPLELLELDPERVVEAARRRMAEAVF